MQLERLASQLTAIPSQPDREDAELQHYQSREDHRLDAYRRHRARDILISRVKHGQIVDSEIIQDYVL